MRQIILSPGIEAVRPGRVDAEALRSQGYEVLDVSGQDVWPGLIDGGGGLGLGEISLDTALRISDDFVDFGDDWFGDTFAQTFLAPDGAVSLVKASVRSGNPGTHPLEVFAGQTQGGEPLGRAYFRIDRGSGRDSAIMVRTAAQSMTSSSAS